MLERVRPAVARILHTGKAHSGDVAAAQKDTRVGSVAATGKSQRVSVKSHPTHTASWRKGLSAFALALCLAGPFGGVAMAAEPPVAPVTTLTDAPAVPPTQPAAPASTPDVASAPDAKPLVTSGHVATGSIDDNVAASNGIDAGDYADPPDNFNGAFTRVEYNQDVKLTGLTIKTPGSDGDPGTHAGVELGGATLRADESAQVTANPGILPGQSAGLDANVDLDNTVGVNIARGSVSHTTQIGPATVTVGAQGYLSATDELDVNANASTSASPDDPNGVAVTNTAGVGGHVDGYVDLQTPTRLGNLDVNVQGGEEYNLAGQTYGNHSDNTLQPYVSATESLQVTPTVTVAANEEAFPGTGAYRVAGSVEKQITPNLTAGVYAGYEQDGSLPGGDSSGFFVGAGMTFSFG